MSLVITAWDASLGIAVSEGRTVAIENGIKVPVSDEHSKLSRLPNGSILGITGGLRDGKTETTARGIVTEPLRRAIHVKAAMLSFRELCAVIPELLRQYGETYPELGFGVSLLGNDNGTIRGASFSSDGQSTDPDCLNPVNASILGLTEEINTEVTAAVREFFTGRSYVHLSETCAALERIIKDAATRHVELNDNIRFEIVGASKEDAPACADGFCLNTLEPKEAGANVTSAHVLTRSSAPSSYANTPSNLAASWTQSPGFGWTMLAAGAEDVFNVTGAASLVLLSGTPGNTYADIGVSIDGAAPAQYLRYYYPATKQTVPLAFSLTGLSAGSHSLTIWVRSDGGSQTQMSATGTQALCQRIF